MKKRIFVIVITIMCAISMCACGQTKDLTDGSREKELEDLQAKYDNLSDNYDALQQQYIDLQNDYDELKQQQEEVTTEAEIEPTITTEEAPADWSDYASDITYDQLARTPDDYVGKAIQMSGEVIQLMEDEDTNAIRLATDDMWDDVIYIEYDPSITDKRVLENDKITVYGLYYGIYQYESTLGQMISVPAMYVEHIEINE